MQDWPFSVCVTHYVRDLEEYKFKKKKKEEEEEEEVAR